MTPDETLRRVLAQLQDSLDRLADDLSRDRPDLAAALQQRADHLPPPELLFAALAAGALDARELDRLLVRRSCVASLRAKRSAA
jgi:hypothetical protein